MVAIGLLFAGRDAGARPAPPPPHLAEARGDSDGDGTPERVRLLRTGEVVVEDLAGRERARVALPVGAEPLASGAIAIVAVEGKPVVHARARTRAGRVYEAVLGGGRPLVVEQTGPIGDGERAVHLKVQADGIWRWQTSPTIRRCDGEERLYLERWDGGAFRPVEPPVPSGTPLEARETRPDGLPAAPVGLFSFTAASTAAHADRRADRLAAPQELADGKLATTWTGGRGDWVVARARDASRRVTALHLRLGGAPKPLAILVEGARYVTRPAARDVWVVLPGGKATACVALVTLEPETVLAEVDVYTEADVGKTALGGLADELARGGPGADGAVEALTHGGAEAARAIAAKLPTATGVGRRRLVDILAALGEPEGAAALAAALKTASAEERDLIVDGLARLGGAATAHVAPIYADAGQAEEARGDAARVLGRIAEGGDGAALEPLLGGAGAGGAALRQATREALAGAGAAQPKAREALQAALARAGGDAQLGDLGRALGTAVHKAEAQAQAQATEALVAAYGRAEGFEARLRLLRALGQAAGAGAAPLLERVAREEADEVLRFAAVQAAAQLGAPGRAILRAAADDRDPRVRRAALEGLAPVAEAADRTRLARALAADGWPLVRKGVAEGLALSCALGRGDGATTAALERAAAGDPAGTGADPSEETRRAALVALGKCAPRSPAFARALGQRSAPPAVREVAAALLVKGGHPEAGKRIAEVLLDVLGDPASDERAAGFAVQLVRALGRTRDGSRPVLEALGAASNEPTSPAIRAAAMESIGALCPDGAREALDRGRQDPDGLVRRAAEAARARCAR